MPQTQPVFQKSQPVIQIGTILDILGVTVEFLTPSEKGVPYCVMRGTIPPGHAVPLHSHADAESFFVISGRAQILDEQGDRLRWLDVGPGDFVHIPGDTKHAHRNLSKEPVVELLTTTVDLARFFQEVGRPFTPGAPQVPPTPDELKHFERMAAKYRHWLASPEENAAVGITLAG